jgi:hypothetical protein
MIRPTCASARPDQTLTRFPTGAQTGAGPHNRLSVARRAMEERDEDCTSMAAEETQSRPAALWFGEKCEASPVPWSEYGAGNRRLWMWSPWTDWTVGVRKRLRDGLYLRSSVNIRDLSALNRLTWPDSGLKLGLNVAGQKVGALPSAWATWTGGSRDGNRVTLRLHKPYWRPMPLLGADLIFRVPYVTVGTSLAPDLGTRMTHAPSSEERDASAVKISHSVSLGQQPWALGAELVYGRSGRGSGREFAPGRGDGKVEIVGDKIGLLDYNVGLDYVRRREDSWWSREDNMGFSLRTKDKTATLVGTMWANVGWTCRVGAVYRYKFLTSESAAGIVIGMDKPPKEGLRIQSRFKMDTDGIAMLAFSASMRDLDHREKNDARFHCSATANLATSERPKVALGFSFGDP